MNFGTGKIKPLNIQWYNLEKTYKFYYFLFICMDTNINVQKILNKIYSKVGYFDIYGGSIVATIFILFVFFVIFSYFNVMSNIKPIKANWTTQRCNPSVIPFAGMINKPPGKTTFQYTSENFNECINSILTNIAGDFFQPIYYVMNAIHSSMKDVTGDIQAVRKKVESVTGNMMSIDEKIMGRILAFLSPLRLMIVKIKDSLAKVSGIGVTSAYTIVGLWLSIQTFIRAFIKMLLDGLYVMIGIIVLLWILPFTWGMAATFTGFFAVAAGLLGVVIAGTEEIVHSGASVPKSPMCFDEDTLIELEDGTVIPIREINVDMKLIDGGLVTAVFKVSQNNMEMYKYNGVIVSGNHNVLHNNEWIPVSEIDEAEKIQNYNKPYLYCLNTTSKKILINNIVFADWDDIDEKELILLRKVIHKYFGLQIHYNNVHRYLEGGFTDKTKVELNDGRCVSIDKIQVNDVLSLGNTVKGIVKISTKDSDVLKYTINDFEIICGQNNIINDDDLGVFSTMEIPHINLTPRNKPKYLYHLITSNGKLCIDGVIFKDYNGSVEHFLEKTTEFT